MKMSYQIRTEELVKNFTDSMREWGLAHLARDDKSISKARKVMNESFRELQKRDKNLTQLVKLIESSGDDATRMVTARWLLGVNEEKALKVLHEIANKHKQDQTRFAGKIAREWREESATNKKRYKYYNLIVGMIVVAGAAYIFSYVYRAVYYGNSVNYFSVLNSLFVIIMALWIYSQKNKVGYYFALFYFSLKLLGGLTYFYLKSPRIFVEMVTIGHVAISASSELLLSIVSFCALFLLIMNSNLRLRDYSRSRVDEVRKISQFKNYFRE